ncbi:hypothetical protein T492DRAFT_1032647 [Pavlovales sp. CCMP2436]|nr:hypothetical protein T492DRAFT_1032647 [Pavlovales sp. CCMP2436]
MCVAPSSACLLEGVVVIPCDAGDSKLSHDVSTLIEVHGGKHAEPRTWLSDKDYLESFLVGGLDGLTTTFAVVAAVVGGSFDWTVAITLGKVVAFAHALRHREAIFGLGRVLISSCLRGERAEKAGNSKVASVLLIDFLSFEFWGSVPLVVFCTLQSSARNAGLDSARLRSVHFGACIVATFLITFALGMCRASFSGSSLVLGGVRTLWTGGIPGGVVFLLAWATSVFIAGSSGSWHMSESGLMVIPGTHC